MKKESQDNSGGIWLIISIALGLWFAYYHSHEDERFLQIAKDYKEVKFNVKDTTYVISINVDSAYYDPQEHEPLERP